MLVTIVLTVSDNRITKSKHVTATSGQESSFHAVGEASRDALVRALGTNVNDADVRLTSVTAA